MTMAAIAWKSLRRRRTRALFIFLGLTVGSGSCVGVLTLSRILGNEIQHRMELYGANIVILPSTDDLSISFGGMNLGSFSLDVSELRQEDLASIWSIPNRRNIAAVGPVLVGTINEQGKKIVLAGVDFRSIPALRPWWRLEGEFPEEGQVLLGSHLAKVLGVKVGDPLPFKGLEWSVSGVLDPTGSQEDSMAFAPLLEVQRVLGKKGKISMAEVAALCSGCPIEEIVGQISAALPNARVQALRQVVEARIHALEQMRKMGLGFSSLVILLGGLVVFVTVSGSLRERVSEIGILRAIGFTRRNIMRLLLMEQGLISLSAGVGGYVLGIMGARAAMSVFFTGHAHSRDLALVGWEMGLGSVLFCTMLGILAGIYPCVSASKLDPVEALRAL